MAEEGLTLTGEILAQSLLAIILKPQTISPGTPTADKQKAALISCKQRMGLFNGLV